MIDKDDDDEDGGDFQDEVWDHVHEEDEEAEARAEKEGMLAEEEAQRFADECRQGELDYEEFMTKYESLQPELRGLQNPDAKVPKYEAYCWGPHKPPMGLSSTTNKRCNEGCGWLICECGKCYCNMPPEMKAKNKWGKPHPIFTQYIDGALICPLCLGRPVYFSDEGDLRFCEECNGKGFQLTNKYTYCTQGGLPGWCEAGRNHS